MLEKKNGKFKKMVNLLRNYVNVNNIKLFAWKCLRTFFIISISYVILFPLFVKISTSIMHRQDIFDQTVRWIPRHITLDNFKLVFVTMDYPRAFMNSFLLSTGVSIVQLISCTLVGYGFARFKFRFKNVFFGLVIFVLIVPPQLLLIPLYLNFRFFDMFGLIPNGGFNLLDSFWPFFLMALTATGIRNSLFIYIIRQFFMGMPKVLQEAAYVDGAGPFKTFFKVMLPGAAPALVVIFIFSFVWMWNDYFYINIFVPDRILLPNMLAELVDEVAEHLVIIDDQFSDVRGITEEYGPMINNTGSLLFLAPLLIFYGVMQRYFVESVERTGIVG
ncbi:MAG: carbohydrate ABC transporter permease [bacterium]